MAYVIYKGNKYQLKNGKIDLSNKGIKDITEIKGLENLKNLKELKLFQNKITEIKGLDTFENLQVLNLGRNKISEITGLTKLINLQTLNLERNLITEIKGLNFTKKIENLNLRNNKISEIKGLDALTNLHRLSLGYNQITEIKGLETLANLQELDFMHNRISEIKGLGSLISLRILYLFLNQINKIERLKTLTNLQELNLSGNKIPEIKGLKALTKLQKLNLFHNQISEIKGLESLINLQELSIGKNLITTIRGLEHLKNLLFLYLGSNKLTEIKGLESLKNLRWLNLQNNQIKDIKGLERLKNLEELYLDGNPITYGPDFLQIMGFKNLKWIEIDYHNLRLDKPQDQEQIREFLKKSYKALKKRYEKIPEQLLKVNNDIKRLELGKLISIANILINLYGDDWEQTKLFRSKLKGPLEERINLEVKNSKEYYRMQALKNVLYAGMERTYNEQLKYLKRAIGFFEKTGQKECEFFYLIYYFLIKSLIAHSEENIDECNKNIDKILDLYSEYEEVDFHASLKKLINELPSIQKDLIDYTIDPHRWKELVAKCSQKCDELIVETFPQLQYSKPGVYRILYHIVNDLRYSWKRVKTERMERDPYVGMKLKDQMKLITHRTHIKHDVFISYSHRDKKTADTLCHFLEQKGIRCRIAPRDVDAGSYTRSIIEAINGCIVMVLVFTKNANFSIHVKKELERAVSKEKPIIPFRTEEVEPIPEIEYCIGDMHWIDALTVPLEKHLSKLVNMISTLLNSIMK